MGREANRQGIRQASGTTAVAADQTLFLAVATAICLVAFVVRTVYVAGVVGLDSPPVNDGISYDLLARSLIAGGGYTLGDGPTAFRPPGYPLFLAGLYGLLGASPALARLSNALLGAMTAALAYSMSRAALGRASIGLLAAAGVAVHPVLIYLSGQVLSETVVITLMLVVLWAMATGPNGLSTSKAAVVATCLGALTLMRPATLVFVVLAALWLALASRDRARGVGHAALVIGVVALCLIPWTVRNYAEFGAFIPLATEGGVTFWGGNNALATGGIIEPAPETWLEPDPPAGLMGWPNLSEKESQDRFLNAGLHWIRTHPVDYALLLPKKLVRAWSLAYGNEARPGGLPGWLSAAYWILPGLALVGAIGARNRWRRLAPFYLLIVAVMATTLVFYGSTRQSAILIPVVVSLAACTVDRVLRWAWAAPRRRSPGEAKSY